MNTPSREHPPPEQGQDYPGRTADMDPAPRDQMRDHEGRRLLAGQRALVTGGDSAHPGEIAPSFVFFASSRMSSYYSGEVLAPVGGETLPTQMIVKHTRIPTGASLSNASRAPR